MPVQFRHELLNVPILFRSLWSAEVVFANCAGAPSVQRLSANSTLSRRLDRDGRSGKRTVRAVVGNSRAGISCEGIGSVPLSLLAAPVGGGLGAI